MKKFLFSMALALGAICMPSQASAAEVSSPVVNNIKATTTLRQQQRSKQLHQMVLSLLLPKMEQSLLFSNVVVYC